MPGCISVGSVLYILPNIPERAAHRMTRIHSQPKKKETTWKEEIMPRIPRIRAETAAKEPTTTA